CLAMLELRPAVDSDTRNTKDRELHHQRLAFFAARVVPRCLLDSAHFTVRKGRGVEARRIKRVLVEPETDRVLWFHVRVLLVSQRGPAVIAKPCVNRHYQPNAKGSEPTSARAAVLGIATI